MTFSSDSSASFLSRCSRTVAADRGGCCGGGGGGGVDDMADVVCALSSAPTKSEDRLNIPKRETHRGDMYRIL